MASSVSTITVSSNPIVATNLEDAYTREFLESLSKTCPTKTLPFESFLLTSYIDSQDPKSFQSLFNSTKPILSDFSITA